jgi:hypothetical protein
MSRRHRQLDHKILDLKALGAQRANAILSNAIDSGNLVRVSIPEATKERIRQNQSRIPSATKPNLDSHAD